jgi:hypothetical protein
VLLVPELLAFDQSDLDGFPQLNCFSLQGHGTGRTARTTPNDHYMGVGKSVIFSSVQRSLVVGRDVFPGTLCEEYHKKI